MKSDQVASRNWRRGQCQSLSLSRSRSWQQRSLQRSVICALALAFNLFALCATATIPPPPSPSCAGHSCPTCHKSCPLQATWPCFGPQLCECTVIAGHICITIVSFHPDHHSLFSIPLRFIVYSIPLHSPVPRPPFLHSAAFRALWRLPPIRIWIRHLMLTANLQLLRFLATKIIASIIEKMPDFPCPCPYTHPDSKSNCRSKKTMRKTKIQIRIATQDSKRLANESLSRRR